MTKFWAGPVIQAQPSIHSPTKKENEQTEEGNKNPPRAHNTTCPRPTLPSSPPPLH
jgi:hypothetical protein